MKKHYFLTLLLGLLSLLIAGPANAQYALSGYCGRRIQFNDDSTNLQWSVDTAQRVLTITGNGRMMDYSIDTKAPWYPWRNQINRIQIGDGVTTVGSYAMYSLDKADSVHLGISIKKIREWAFGYCYALRSVSFPATTDTIEDYAFRNNNQMQWIDFGEAPAYIFYEAFSYLQSLKEIRSRRIKQINSWAFQNCANLISLQLGDSLKQIGGYAFCGCNSLRSLHIPATCTYIGEASFTYAYVLDTITVNPGNSTYNSNNQCNAVMQTSNNTLVVGCRKTIIPAETQRIGSSAFEGCIGLVSAILPDGLTYIGSNAFQSCTGLTTINLPNSVTAVDCFAFENCTSLATPIYNQHLFARMPQRHKGIYTMPNTIREICCGAFSSCDSLSNITLSDSLRRINSHAFRNCYSLHSISIPNRVNEIAYAAFEYCYSLQSIIMPDSLATIGGYAFSSCRSLRSISIPDAVYSINYAAFSSCSSLQSITFPSNLHDLGEYVFSGCDSLKSIVWNAKDAHLCWFFYSNYSDSEISERMESYHPFYNIRKQIQSFTLGDSVRVIPRYLCYGMENLTSLSLGYNIDSIENHVFDGCKHINSVTWNVRTLRNPSIYTKAPFYDIRDTITSFTFGDSVRHIPAYLCHGMSRLHRLHIPENVSSIGDYAFRYLGTLDSISVDVSNSFFDSRNGCNALINSSNDMLMLGCYKTLIPSNIAGIDAYAFRNVRNFTTANLPESVQFIGREAFNGCVDLKNLSLPRKLTAINDYAFQDCDSLYNVTLPDSLWFIGLRAFGNCSHLQEITLPESVELLDQFAFSGCNRLRSITCLAPVPPTIQETTFRGTSCPIYVPCSSIASYRTAPVWTDYGTRVAGLYSYVLTVRPNDYSFGHVTILQQPDCEHNAVLLAQPIFGHSFVSWQDTLGNVLSTEPQFEFSLNKDITIIGEFKVDIVAIEEATEEQQTIKIMKDGQLIIRRNDHIYDTTGRLLQ